MVVPFKPRMILSATFGTTSTREKVSRISILPTWDPSTPASPAMAPRRSPGPTPSFSPTATKRRTQAFGGGPLDGSAVPSVRTVSASGPFRWSLGDLQKGQAAAATSAGE